MDLTAQQTIESFFAGFKSVRYRRGEIILRQHDMPQGVEYVQTGYVRMYRVFEDGSQLTVNIFKPGSYFPMPWAICDLKNEYYFQAISSTATWRAPKKEVVEFVKQHPLILFELTQRLVGGYCGLLLHTENLIIGNAYQKVVSVLVMLVRRFGQIRENNLRVIGLPFSHQDIADFAHLSRETTSLQMKKLKDEGLVSYGGKQIIILELEGLECRLFTKE